MNSLGNEVPDPRFYERDKILSALERWIRQRPGLEFGNYGDVPAYRAELRSIGRDLRDARALLRYVARSQMPADTLRTALRDHYSGRLQWDGKSLDYTTGQYWPTEYRRAVCAVLAGAIWAYHRELDTNRDGFRERMKKFASAEFGRGIAKRWFN